MIEQICNEGHGAWDQSVDLIHIERDKNIIDESGQYSIARGFSRRLYNYCQPSDDNLMNICNAGGASVYLLLDNLSRRFRHEMDQVWSEIKPEWVNSKGKLPKRFARYVNDYLKGAGVSYKLPDSFWGEVGSDLSGWSSSAGDYYIHHTRYIDWGKNDLGQECSCWWASYSHALYTLIAGGHGAMVFSSGQDKYSDRYGRAWFIDTPDVCYLFNGYGVRLRDFMVALKSVGYAVRDYSYSDDNKIASKIRNVMYFNGDWIGIAKAESSLPVSGVRIDADTFDSRGWSYKNHPLLDLVSMGKMASSGTMDICCNDCGDYIDGDDINEIEIDGYSRYVCNYCLSNYCCCDRCGEYVSSYRSTSEGHEYCYDCAESLGLVVCGSCGHWHDETDMYTVVDSTHFRFIWDSVNALPSLTRSVCHDCFDSNEATTCDCCGTSYNNNRNAFVIDGLCILCVAYNDNCDLDQYGVSFDDMRAYSEYLNVFTSYNPGRADLLFKGLRQYKLSNNLEVC